MKTHKIILKVACLIIFFLLVTRISALVKNMRNIWKDQFEKNHNTKTHKTVECRQKYQLFFKVRVLSIINICNRNLEFNIILYIK